ncbi:MAG: DUF58 domain-containing protein [Akkermansia sp.]
MDDKASEILKRVRRIELKARRMAAENFAGQYQSGFRGQGLDFDDFREYLSGDDPRFIDWKVTARMGSPYVRRFREEREQALILVVDTSGSMNYASAGAKSTKLEYAAEIAAVLAFSAVQSGDKCGLLIYGQKKRFYLPPAKGVRQTLRIIREILSSHEECPDDNLSDVADMLLSTQKKTAIVIMISDFQGDINRAALGKLSFKHELIPVRVADQAELSLPDAGRIIANDAENGGSYYINLSKPEIREVHNQLVKNHRDAWVKEFNRLGLDYLDLDNRKPFLSALKAVFSKRSRKFAH